MYLLRCLLILTEVDANAFATSGIPMTFGLIPVGIKDGCVLAISILLDGLRRCAVLSTLSAEARRRIAKLKSLFENKKNVRCKHT